MPRDSGSTMSPDRARAWAAGVAILVVVTVVASAFFLNQVLDAGNTVALRVDGRRTSIETGAATVGDIAEPFDMSLPAVSRHLRVLTDAGLIERHTEAQWRRCELRGEGLRAAADWIDEYRRFWEQQFDRLEAYLKRTAPQSKGKRDARKRRS